MIEKVYACDYLRHQLPFRFIEAVCVSDDSSGEAHVPMYPPEVKWANHYTLSVLPVEYAAQLAGVLIRIKLGSRNTISMLAGVSSFAWSNLPEPLVSVNVAIEEPLGDFYNFEALFTGQRENVCLKISGAIYLSLSGQNFISKLDDMKIFDQNKVSVDKPLYKILRYNSDSEKNITMSVRTEAECPVYLAHFPGMPITPGVLIAEMMVSAVTRSQASLALRSITSLSFSAPLLPNEEVDLVLKFIKQHHYSASFFRENKRIARAKIEFAPYSSARVD